MPSDPIFRDPSGNTTNCKTGAKTDKKRQARISALLGLAWFGSLCIFSVLLQTVDWTHSFLDGKPECWLVLAGAFDVELHLEACTLLSE